MPSNIIEKESMKKLLAQLFKDVPTSKSQDIQNITVKTEAKEPEASVPVKEKVMPEQPPHADIPSYRHEDLKLKESFSFEAHMRAYEQQQQKGNRKLEAILSALSGNKEAYSRVALYFASDSVKWNVKKYKLYLQENITYWKKLRQKYGDGGNVNYSQSIRTNEFILQTLDKLDNVLKEIDRE